MLGAMLLLQRLVPIALLSCQTATPAPPGQTVAAPPSSCLDRVAVLGASLSDGFNLATELEAKADLGTFLAAALRGERAPVAVAADSFFFSDPDAVGERLVQTVRESEPSAVLALDFLFWFAYGAVPGEAVRPGRFERGLALLDTLEGPLVVADLADVRQALDGEGFFGQPMITPAQVPAPESLERLNARLRQWAEERGDVVVVPLADWLRRIQSGEAVELRGNGIPGAEAMQRLIQPDLLHPTVDGTVLVVLLALDALEQARDDVADADVRWSLADVRARVMEATAAEREEKRERERRREERRKEREARKSGD